MNNNNVKILIDEPKEYSYITNLKVVVKISQMTSISTAFFVLLELNISINNICDIVMI